METVALHLNTTKQMKKEENTSNVELIKNLD